MSCQVCNRAVRAQGRTCDKARSGKLGLHIPKQALQEHLPQYQQMQRYTHCELLALDEHTTFRLYLDRSMSRVTWHASGTGVDSC
jgi:hypothetical protein